jgi:hypothetical protein
MSTANFRIDDRPEADEAALVAITDRLEPTHALEFHVACMQLLDTGRRKLIMNLSRVHAIPSVIFGAVLDAYALTEGRELVLVADAQATDKFMKLVPKLIARVEPPAEGPEEEPEEEKKEEG